MWPWWCAGLYDTVILSCLVQMYFPIVQFRIPYIILWIYVPCCIVHWSAAWCIGLGFGYVSFWCCVSCAPFTIFLIDCYFIMVFIIIVVTNIGIFVAILFILNYTFRLSVTKFWFCKCATPWEFPLLDIFLEYWIEYGCPLFENLA